MINNEEINRTVENSLIENHKLTEIYAEKIEYINKQNECLNWFFANYKNMIMQRKITVNNTSQFLVLMSLLGSIIKTKEIFISSTRQGNYLIAGMIVRFVLETSFLLRNLKDAELVNDWMERNNLEYKKVELSNECKYLTEEEKHKLNCLSGKFGTAALVNGIKPKGFNSKEWIKYYNFYRRLCTYTHPSDEHLRFNLGKAETNNLPEPKIGFVFSEDRCEAYFDTYFGFINDAIWEGIKETFTFVEEIPRPMIAYKLLQEKDLSKVFPVYYAND